MKAHAFQLKMFVIEKKTLVFIKFTAVKKNICSLCYHSLFINFIPFPVIYI